MYSTWTEYAKAHHWEVTALVRLMSRIEQTTDKRTQERLVKKLQSMTSAEEFAYWIEAFGLDGKGAHHG